METWDVEVAYGIRFTVSGIKAENQADAIYKARLLVERGTTILPYDGSVDARGLEFQQVTFAKLT